jgi:hypothetical protein
MIASARKLSHRQTSRTYSVPAPVGGLNARDAVAAMPESDAVELENFFCTPTEVQLRNGSDVWASGLPGWCETLMTYSGATGSKMFAIAVSGSAGSVYDVTTQGAVGAAAVSGLSNARWEYTNFATPGGQFLYAANASDAPLLYNGSTWQSVTAVSTPLAITGVTTTKLRNPTVWKSRLWFVEDGSMRAWYLPTQSVGGAAASIDLGAFFRRGGVLQNIFSVSMDSGNTIDDYIAFISSEGEIALYKGTDPASATTFAMIGLFRCGRPIGRRNTFKIQGDTIIVSADGLFPFSVVMTSNDSLPSKTISYKILNRINDDVQAYAGSFGWQGILYPIGNKVIVNVPQVERFKQYQYVQNTITGAWSTFTGWNAACFELMGDTLFYGGNGYVARCDYGSSDQGNAITGYCTPAFGYFGSQQQKMFKMVRPIIISNVSLSVGVGLNVDFQSTRPSTYTSVNGIPDALWDTAIWDVDLWSDTDFLQKNWLSVTGIGFAASISMVISTTSARVRLQAIDYLFEPGGVW